MASVTRTISQAELRNSCDRVIDALEAGQDFIITRDGHPVGELRPIRQARDVSTADLKARLARFGGTADGATERTAIDCAFGADRLDD